MRQSALLPLALALGACWSAPHASRSGEPAAAAVPAPAAAAGAPKPAASDMPDASARAGATPEAAPRLSFRILAHCPATLVYAPELAAGVRAPPDARYRPWLLAPDGSKPPIWLEAYGEQRRTRGKSVDQGDGSYDPYAACGYDSETLDALLACAAQLLKAG